MWKAFLITSHQGYMISTWSLSAKFLHSVVVFPFPFSIFGFPDGSVVRNLTANARDIGDAGSIPRLGRFPGEGNGNPFQYSYLGNPVDRGAWWATVQRVTKNLTQLSDWAHSTFYSLEMSHQVQPTLKGREIKLHLLDWGFSSYITWYPSVRKVCPFFLLLKCFPVIYVFQYELEYFLFVWLYQVSVVACKLLAVACGI